MVQLYTRITHIDGSETYAPVPPVAPTASPILPFAFGPNARGVYLSAAAVPRDARSPSGMDYAPLEEIGNCFPNEDIADRASTMRVTSSRWISAALAADSDAGPWAPGRQWVVAADGKGNLRAMVHLQHEQCPGMPYVHTEILAKQMIQILQNAGWA